ncbi:MAG: ABC transporter ATP-binding protein [Cyanobacteriota bacterium]|nr:ABC transporter ATP-binding protein [Cyanobacteriota bacterium]
MAGVTFDHVTKKYGDTTVVSDLNITIEDGEFLVFVGPSGCGKTTSLRMLAGLEAISQGNIYIGDRCVNQVPPKDRDIAMVFQSYALYPHMTVAENMSFGLKLRSVPRAEIESRVKSVAKRLGIEHLLARKPKELSGGQRQRVAVGRAIVRNPAVFLMDEPLSNLDAKLRVQARAEISKLHTQLGTTFIYVTHDQVEAMTMGSRIAVMKDGHLQQIDTPQHLYSHPSNIFVAGFIGSPAMNFFTVRLVEGDPDWVLESASFRLPLLPQQVVQYQAYRGQEVILGIRPENIHDPQYLPQGIQPTLIKARVTVIEQMGNEVILYLATPDRDGTQAEQEFVARVDPRTHIQVGQWVEVALDRERLHLFDRQTEKTIAG